jgi:hypothetical protein
MVKKEIQSADELKKELEASKAKLALLNKKSRHSVKDKPKKKEAKKKTEVKRSETKKLEVSKLEARKTEVKKAEAKKKEAKKKAEAKKKEAKKKAEAKKKEAKKKEAKKKEAKKKAEAKKKEAKKKAEAKKKEAKKKAEEAKKKAEEAKKKAEEAKKKEEEAKKTYEEELEEQLTEEEITGFQIDKTDMDRLSNKVCEIVAGYETEGMFQSELWKKLKLSSRDGSRLALKLERMGMISREKILENGRWTYKLIIKRTPVSTSSLEGAPCLTCPVEAQCSIDGEISPKTCQFIDDWVRIESKHSN